MSDTEKCPHCGASKSIPDGYYVDASPPTELQQCFGKEAERMARLAFWGIKWQIKLR